MATYFKWAGLGPAFLVGALSLAGPAQAQSPAPEPFTYLTSWYARA
jgi:hypothetical protein